MTVALPTGTTLGTLSDLVAGQCPPDLRDMPVTGFAALAAAKPGDLAFCATEKATRALSGFTGSALLISSRLVPSVTTNAACIVVADAYLSYAIVSQWIARERAAHQAPGTMIHPSAVVDPSAVIGQGVRLGPGVVVGRDVLIGAHSRLEANVVVYQGCSIGERCIIHAGTVIGADGFGFAPCAQGWVKIEQLGAVKIADDVEIGANCAIDRGALDDTVIGRGTKLDNLIQVAHNVQIGEHCAIAGCVGIAGSAVIGNRVQIGGGAGILGHLSICDDAVISSMTLIASSIKKPGFYTGVYPVDTNAQWEKSAAVVRQLPDLRQRLRVLEQQFSKDS